MGVRPGTPDEPALLERASHLAALRAARQAVLDGRGSLVLVAGEAGSGKTALLRRFRDECEPPGRVLWGACDPLFTPRPLGPFADVAEQAGGELAALLAARREAVRDRGGDRGPGAVAPRHRGRVRGPALGRRGDARRAEPAGPAHRVGAGPPRRLLPRRRAGTVHFGRSSGSCARPCGCGRSRSRRPRSPRSPGRPVWTRTELHRVTGGNPFFVSEVVAAGGERIPPTVREAVLARAARLSRRGGGCPRRGVGRGPVRRAGAARRARAGRRRTVSTSAWPRACCTRSPRASRSGTSWAAGRWRSRWARTAAATCTGGRCPR